MGNALRIVYTTVQTSEDAANLSSLLISEKLAACVNIAPIRSVYAYESKIYDSEEYSMLIKTSEYSLDKMVSFLDNIHPYDVPAIIVFPPCRTTPEFLEFVNQNTIGDVSSIY